MASGGASLPTRIRPVTPPSRDIDNPTGRVPGQSSGRVGTTSTPAPGVTRLSPSRPPAARSSPGRGGTSYGYSTTSRAPFNPYASYPTVGALNKAAIAAAAPGYQPQLDQNAADLAAENAASKQRTTDLTGIYSQYGNQAQQAFNETRDALNAMIGANATGDQQSQGVLQAALSSATGGQNSLAQMMGMSGPAPAQEIAPYASAAQGAARGTGSELQALSGGLLSTSGNAVADAAMEGAQQQNIESLRHGAAVQSNEQSRSALIDQIPDLIEKAREQLISDSLNASGLQFQQQLAAKQFGLSEKTANANIANAAATTDINRQNSAENRRVAEATLQSNQQTQALNQQALQAKIQQSKATLAIALAKTTGQREAGALKWLTSWVTPTPEELAKKSTTTIDPKTQATIRITAGQIDPTRWHRDAGMALKTLMTVYGLDLKTALSYMSTLTAPIGGGVNMTIGQWASTFIARAAADRHPAAQSGWLSGIIKQIQSAANSVNSIPRSVR